MPAHSICRKIPVADLRRVDRPIAAACGMPNAAYTDAEAFVFERDHVLGAGWAALAFADEVAENLSVKPVEFMGLPLFLARGRDGEVKVFHNVCSHRGMRLVRDARKTNGALVCPYHAWSYDLDGALKATPHIGGAGKHTAPSFDCKAHGLKPVRSQVWLGVVFINLDGRASPFARHIKPLLARYAGFVGPRGWDALRLAGDHAGLSLTADCNWKLAVENYAESYHLPWVHPGLNSYSPLDQHHNVLIGANFAGQATSSFTPDSGRGGDFPEFADWPQDNRQHAEYPVFYPNLLLGIQSNHVYALIVHPIAADKTREDLRIFYLGAAADDAAFASQRKRNLEAWRAVFVEDIGAVEGMQAGRDSPGYRGGAFSPVQDTCSHHFHRWIARKYRAAYAAAA